MHFRLNRRRFVQGIAGTALLGSAGLARGTNDRAVLHVPEFDLTVDEMPVNITGAPRRAVVVNGQLPAPLLRARQGDDVTIRVKNRLRASTSIHWHGLIVPADMDGVPGLSFDGIAPGTTFTYRFRVNQSGTYWYHSHSRFQEQVGLYGPLVVDRRDGERHTHDREHVVLLSDWTDLDPEAIYSTLKKQSDYFNYGKRTLGEFMRDARDRGYSATARDHRMWAAMRMNPTDLADVGGHAYTYLLNGASPAANWTGTFVPGERVRLRLINGSSMSFFDVRIPGLQMTVVASDGQDVEPVTVDELRIGTAEVYDVIVQPRDAAYTIFAQPMDRSGYARGTLAPRVGMNAEVPPLDPRPLLSMADMGHGAQGHGEIDHSKMDHAAMGHAMPAAASPGAAPHGADEHGPLADMVADSPSSALDDPGVGLRDNGRRVLTYADLQTLGGPIDSRDASREIELHLTGHMERYVWSFDGRKFSDATPLRFAHGERLRIVLVNDTMMTHPIHLHGMWSELVDEKGAFLARKHTVSVRPGQRLAYLVTADALGHWAYHCHLLYHMEAGMFREVVVA
ncbi:MAG: copper resistance system multicopper oxidase [Steroidobacteraceae bacterium]|nr:copper resistance system multicopper oxidase [Steroidobacteraceae bacterium]